MHLLPIIAIIVAGVLEPSGRAHARPGQVFVPVFRAAHVLAEQVFVVVVELGNSTLLGRATDCTDPDLQTPYRNQEIISR